MGPVKVFYAYVANEYGRKVLSRMGMALTLECSHNKDQFDQNSVSQTIFLETIFHVFSDNINLENPF